MLLGISVACTYYVHLPSIDYVQCLRSDHAVILDTVKAHVTYLLLRSHFQMIFYIIRCCMLLSYF